MAPTIKWQRWDSASYDWYGVTATDALPTLEAELDAWITAVNGNASNSGRQVTKERGYADSTTLDYAGLVISCGANGNTEKGYMAYGTYNSTTNKSIYLGNTYADDTSRGGYGTISGGVQDSGVSTRTSGQEASWLIVSSIVDGQEYFCYGPTFGTNPSVNYQDGFFIFKATDGEWSMTSGDGSIGLHTHYWDDGLSTGWSSCNRTGNSYDDVMLVQGNNTYGRYGLFPGSPVNVANPVTQGAQVVYAANPDVLTANTGASFYYTGRRRVMTTLGNGQDVYILNGYYYGPTFLVDLRS